MQAPERCKFGIWSADLHSSGRSNSIQRSGHMRELCILPHIRVLSKELATVFTVDPPKDPHAWFHADCALSPIPRSLSRTLLPGPSKVLRPILEKQN